MTLTDALKEDLQRMEDIACEAGFRVKGYVVRGKTRSQMDWAFAVALKHIIEILLKRVEKKDG